MRSFTRAAARQKQKIPAQEKVGGMRVRLFGWAAAAVCTGEIDLRKGRFVAALANGPHLPNAKTLVDFLRRGNVVATAPVDLSSLNEGDKIEFTATPGERIGSVILYQESGPEGGETLPPDRQRLLVQLERIKGLPAPVPPSGKVTVRWVEPLGEWAKGVHEVYGPETDNAPAEIGG